MTLPFRRSPRLPEMDYREPGAYFVTICSHDRQHVFGGVDNGTMALSRLGQVANSEWLRTTELRPFLEIDQHVVMPNHVHLLFGLWTSVTLDQGAIPTDGASPVPTDADAASKSVSAIIGGYKSAVTRRARREGLWDDRPLWQTRFHDRVVRNDRERNAIREYITQNPRRWHQDRYRHG